MLKEDLRYQFRYDIEKLRGIAVTFVILYHIWPDSFLRQFFVGVDIFFVISGYVIAQTVHKLSSRPRKTNVKYKEIIVGFMQNRVRRIMPPLLVCIAICSFIGFLFIRPESYAYSVSIKTGALSLVGISNIYLAKIASDYFSVNAQQNLFENTWSLGVELQFYAAIILFWVFLEGIKRRGGDYWRKLVIFSLIAAAIALGIFNANNYYTFLGRMWEFGVGVGCYTIYTRYRFDQRCTSWNSLYARDAGILISILIAICLIAFRDYSQIGIRVFACLSIAAKLVFLPETTSNESRFSSLRYLGQRSYSLYLYHWPILFVARITFGLDSTADIVGAILAIVIVGELSYLFVENRVEFTKGKKSIVTILFLSLGTCLSMLGLELLSGRFNIYSGTRDSELRKVRLPEAKSCSRDKFVASKSLDECGEFLGEGKPTVVLVGDSHAGQFRRGIKELAIQEGLAYAVLSDNGCIFPYAPIQQVGVCENRTKAVTELLQDSLGKGDRVILINSFHGYFAGEGIQQKPSAKVSSGYYSEALLRFAKEMKTRGIRVEVLLPGLFFWHLENGVNCQAEWFNSSSIEKSCFTEMRQFENERVVYLRYLQEIAEDGWISLFDGFLKHTCSSGVCSAREYYDSNHYFGGYAEENFLKIFGKN